MASFSFEFLVFWFSCGAENGAFESSFSAQRSAGEAERGTWPAQIVMTGAGPENAVAGTEEFRQRQSHQQVTKRRWVQDARIMERGEPLTLSASQRLVAHFQFPRLFGPLIKRLRTILIDLVLVLHQVAEENASMCSGSTKRDYFVLKLLNQKWSRNAEQICRLGCARLV